MYKRCLTFFQCLEIIRGTYLSNGPLRWRPDVTGFSGRVERAAPLRSKMCEGGTTVALFGFSEPEGGVRTSRTNAE